MKLHSCAFQQQFNWLTYSSRFLSQVSIRSFSIFSFNLNASTLHFSSAAWKYSIYLKLGLAVQENIFSCHSVTRKTPASENQFTMLFFVGVEMLHKKEGQLYLGFSCIFVTFSAAVMNLCSLLGVFPVRHLTLYLQQKPKRPNVLFSARTPTQSGQRQLTSLAANASVFILFWGSLRSCSRWRVKRVNRSARFLRMVCIFML